MLLWITILLLVFTVEILLFLGTFIDILFRMLVKAIVETVRERSRTIYVREFGRGLI